MTVWKHDCLCESVRGCLCEAVTPDMCLCCSLRLSDCLSTCVLQPLPIIFLGQLVRPRTASTEGPCPATGRELGRQAPPTNQLTTQLADQPTNPTNAWQVQRPPLWSRSWVPTAPRACWCPPQVGRLPSLRARARVCVCVRAGGSGRVCASERACVLNVMCVNLHAGALHRWARSALLLYLHHY